MMSRMKRWLLPGTVIPLLSVCVVVVHAENPNLMLVAEDGAVCYVEFENQTETPARDWVATYDQRYTGSLPQAGVSGIQVVVIANGMVESRGQTPSTIGPGQRVVCTRLNDWLDLHAAPGQALQIRPAVPFRPDSHSHSLDIINAQITEQRNMACYTPQFGKSTPATIFRRELIVSNGRIVARGGGNSDIPNDGSVISGWGSSALWLSRWGMMGAKVTTSNEQVTITVDDETWFLHAKHYLELVRSRLKSNRSVIAGPSLKGQYAKLKTLEKMMDLARSKLNSERGESWRLVCQAIAETKQLLYTTTVSPPDEMRGVLQPGISAGPGLTDQIRRFRSAGVNSVVALKTLDTPESVADLKAAFSQLKQHGFKPMLWTFLPMRPIRSFDVLLKQHPEWQDCDSSGNPLGTPDPLCLEAMAWWCKDTEEVCRSCELDGILFDYEGYYGGYSERSRQGFAVQEGLSPSFDPKTLNLLKTEDPLARKWLEWRRKIIINACDQLSRSAHKGRTNIHVLGCMTAIGYLGSDIQIDSTLHMIWPDWLERGTFDSIATMVYAQDARWVEDSIKRTAKIINGRCHFWPILILYPETGGSAVTEPELLIAQVEAARRAGTKGVLLFMGEQFMPHQGPAGDDIYNCLREGLFRSTVR